MKAIKYMIEEACKKDDLDNLSREQLCKLVNDIYAKAEEAEDFTPLEVEAIQDLMWVFVDSLHPYYEDSRETLATIRDWGIEFEEWWQSLTEDDKDETDYFTEIYNFGDKKMKAFRYPDLRDKLTNIANEVEKWKWKTDEDKNILTKLNCIIDQLKKEE